MEAILNWVKGIMGCILVMSLVLQSTPGKIYRPYLRLFMGIILILSVVSPLAELSGLTSALETLVGELAYREEVPGWEEKLLEGDDWAQEQIIAKAQEMSREAEENQAGIQNSVDEAEAAEERPPIQIEVEVEEIKPVVIGGGESNNDK